jgi:hypothetical protein
MMRHLVILGVCTTLFGCATEPSGTVTKAAAPESVTFDTVPWRWADYSNRVWIAVQGVGVEVPSTNGTSLKKVNFSYSPNTGRSTAEAIAISSFNMFSGRRAEQLLLKVLFGMKGTSLSSSNLLSDGKAFHIYSFKTSEGTTNTTYFDATMYYHLF